MKTKPEVPVYITYRNAVRGIPSHGREGNMHKKMKKMVRCEEIIPEIS